MDSQDGSALSRMRRNWRANTAADIEGSWSDYLHGFVPFLIALAVLDGLLVAFGFSRLAIQFSGAFFAGAAGSLVTRVIGRARRSRTEQR